MALAVGSWTVPYEMFSSRELIPLLPISDTYCAELESFAHIDDPGQYL